MKGIDIEFIAGRPCLVIGTPTALRALATTLSQITKQQVYRGVLPDPDLLEIAREAARAEAVALLVPRAEPAQAETRSSRTRWVTTAEASAALGITQRAVRKRIHNNQLAGRLEGGRWFIDLRKVQPDAAA